LALTILESYLAAVDPLDLVAAAVLNADATLSTDVGGHQELTHVRLWRGQVLVDWEPDAQAGGCLLRPELLRRLIALHASARSTDESLTLTASGRVVASLSPAHGDLVRRLGGARRVELRIVLLFGGGEYRGGDETYYVRERGKELTLLRLRAQVSSRSVAANVARGDVMGPSSRV
jgi:hypothetical protein